MILLEACRRYNEFVRKMFQAAQIEDWDSVFELEQESRKYSDFIVEQSQQGVQITEDAEVRVFLAEVLSFYQEIARLAEVHRSELRTELSLGVIIGKLGKLYGG